MFAHFNYSRFPIVKVVFNKNIKNNLDFELFLIQWMALYDKKIHFKFVFDTRKMGIIGIQYCIRMAQFIKKLKKYPIQYLEKSVIIVKNSFIRSLLDLIFSLEKPVAPVYITKEIDLVENILEDTYKNYNKKVSLILPKSYT